jgi:hypothetical protein
MKLIYLSLLSLFLGCASNKQLPTKYQLISKKGVLIFTSLNFDYFFPASDSTNLDPFSFYEGNFEKGFLLTNVSPSIKYRLKVEFSDTLLHKFNYPATNILPVELKYYLPTATADSSTGEFWLITNNGKKSSFKFDMNQRFVKDINPLFKYKKGN